ncbi:MAG: Ser-Thr-rich GPI-anchored membrane family protein [Candidatus Helarchaeota archaeon]
MIKNKNTNKKIVAFVIISIVIISILTIINFNIKGKIQNKEDYNNIQIVRNGAWVFSIENLSSDFSGQYIGSMIKIDSGDNPNILYYNGTRLVYKVWTGAQWVNYTPPRYNKIFSFVLDSNDYPHISFIDGYQLYYEKWNGSGWEYEIVDSDIASSIFVGGSDIALDSSNNPYIAYEDSKYSNIKLAKWNGTGWEIQFVDSTCIPKNVEIKLDSSNNPHICYLDMSEYLGPYYNETSAIKYAKWNGTGWEISIIEYGVAGSSYTFPSISLDSSDNPHVVYSHNDWSSDPEERDLALVYAKWNGTGWEINYLNPFLNDYEYITYEYTTIVIDSFDRPHICFLYDPSTGGHKLNYLRKINNSWEMNRIDSNLENIYSKIGLDLDSNDFPYIVYIANEDNKQLRYAKPLYWGNINITSPNGEIWYEDGTYNITWTSNSVNSVDITLYKLEFKSLTSSKNTWKCYSTIATSISASTGKYIWNIPKGMDDSSFYYINITDSDHRDIYDCSSLFRISQQKGLFIEQLDISATMTSIVIDSLDNPHICYYNKSGDKLEYVHWESGHWNFEEIDPLNDSVGIYVSLAVDSTNKPHIAYYDALNKDLKYANYNGANWIIQTIDSTNDVGKYPSITVDSSNYPHISYYDETNKALRLIRWTGTQWWKGTLDSEDDVDGKYTSIALDSSNREHIGYQYEDGSISGVKYIYFNGSGWEKQIVYSSTTIIHDSYNYTTGKSISIDIDSSNVPHLSFIKNRRYLMYCKWNGTGWTIETLDSSSSLIDSSSMKLDSAGMPRICYEGDDFLNYTWWDGSKWNKYGVIETLYVANCSISIDSNNKPHFCVSIQNDLYYVMELDMIQSPSSPINLVGSLTNGNVFLDWEEPYDGGSEIIKYNIYCYSVLLPIPELIGYADGSSTNYTDTSNLPRGTYYYYVTAVNSYGESSKSAVISIVIDFSILLVDDDNGNGYESYFIDALNTLNYSYRVWDVYLLGSPSIGTLLLYPTIIWTTGSENSDTLTRTDQNNLIEYLNYGGTLYLSSQDFLFDANYGYTGNITNTFVNQYLHISGVSNDVSYPLIKGIRLDPISTVFGLILLDYPYSNFADEVTMITGSGASKVFYNPITNMTTSVKVDSGVYRLVFTAFSFESIAERNATKGSQLLNRIIIWLQNRNIPSRIPGFNFTDLLLVMMGILSLGYLFIRRKRSEFIGYF